MSSSCVQARNQPEVAVAGRFGPASGDKAGQGNRSERSRCARQNPCRVARARVMLAACGPDSRTGHPSELGNCGPSRVSRLSLKSMRRHESLLAQAGQAKLADQSGQIRYSQPRNSCGNLEVAVGGTSCGKETAPSYARRCPSCKSSWSANPGQRQRQQSQIVSARVDQQALAESFPPPKAHAARRAGQVPARQRAP